MQRFSEFNIKATARAFEGDKIKISKVLNREIIVHHYKIEPSKVFADRGTGQCLCLQLTLNNEKHILFTSSSGLIEQIQQVPESGFPFTATITEQNEKYLFT